MFLIFATPKDFFILSTFKILKIKTNQILSSKENLGIFGPRTFDCDVTTQITSEDASWSQTVWAYSFDGSFSLPEECKDPSFSLLEDITL